MDYEAIKDLIKTASEQELTYLNVESEGMHIIMKKGSQEIDTRVEDNVATSKISDTNEIIKEDKPIIEKKLVTEDKNIKVVKSPIVGTFYTSGDPKAGAFTKIGSKVKKGDVLCIIEAMKLMNEIDAEFDGEVIEILVENEQMVEYGQGLFKIKCN
ncbi:acetyl-CoA carboxylase biotin carboxyl carrier protein [Clostridium akagii]|uniref:acetyl-CoA carboxylase biotin carboxyl carrier protein n=1 Tax=Clostridium akagii TaxID=91623 RepID=UPI00047C26FF|nr:acetyl-CoA carboxylase biotin carboxyl carrier protein [Clostridium akagii]